MVELLAEGDVSARYTSLRLALNLVRRPDARLDGWERMARDEEVRGEAMTRMVAHQLADEIDFIKNPI